MVWAQDCGPGRQAGSQAGSHCGFLAATASLPTLAACLASSTISAAQALASTAPGPLCSHPAHPAPLQHHPEQPVAQLSSMSSSCPGVRSHLTIAAACGVSQPLEQCLTSSRYDGQAVIRVPYQLFACRSASVGPLPKSSSQCSTSHTGCECTTDSTAARLSGMPASPTADRALFGSGNCPASRHRHAVRRSPACTGCPVGLVCMLASFNT